jgi:hypothetical protein
MEPADENLERFSRRVTRHLNLQSEAAELTDEIELLVEEIGDLDDDKVQVGKRIKSVKGVLQVTMDREHYENVPKEVDVEMKRLVRSEMKVVKDLYAEKEKELSSGFISLFLTN